MATFLANEIKSTERDITGPTAHVRIMFPLKEKKIQGVHRMQIWRTTRSAPGTSRMKASLVRL